LAPTIKEVAEMAGVSITTVSFVLNNKQPQVDGLSAETRERVKACAAELGYRRNPTAVSLRSGKSLWIGVVIQPVRDESEAAAWAPYELALISGVENALLDHGYFPVLGSKSTTGETQALDTLAYSGVAGLIYRRPLREEVKRLMELRSEGVASVAVFPSRAADLYPYQVDLDNYKAGDMGAELLCGTGSTRLAIVGSGLFGHIEEDRTRGFSEGVEKRIGAPPIRCDVSGAPSDDVRREMMATFLRRQKPDAILATEPGVSFVVTHAAEQVGLRVPQDLVIVGFDCYSFRAARDQVVTAITTSWWDAGRVAAQSIVDIVQNRTEWEQPKKLEPRCIPGDTTPPDLCPEGVKSWLI
jgi:DNA-binding LacI/PurR family transcriptional regulator